MSDVKVELEASIPSHSPKRMYKAMHHAIFSKKDNCLPSALLCMAASELLGAPREAALPTAVTLEILHAAIHAHKDFYSLETHKHDDERPSVGKMYGLDVALLSGQALPALGFQHVISKTSPHLVPHKILTRVIIEIARSMGSTGMYAGLYLDLDKKSITREDEVMLVLEKIFGEMAGCSVLCGGLIGGAKDNELQALRRYGKTVGVLYEM
ncbi:hypothetical protein LUZ60_016740 [Juncus effusus]|nr:hypothetical protein LUZ60_016740 [Juncus effusus]